ncbi:hypothetical protein DFH07DRAFT_772225 [Mycena maculata]|uniref:Uncharacterized protein n=1 Tax=Mycena maculata TaxID=230809 RepID=A0AAD7J8Q1_9AGAR|nr:hypothetical protein DFH07DRAFT_772225 [Mycena maculata]
MTRRCNCGICGSSLVSQVAKGGKVPGSEFVRCTNHNPPWFYRFPDMHNTPASIAPPIVHTAAAIAPPSVPLLPMMCKKHCNMTGPCRLPTHDKKRREKEEAASSQPAPLTDPVHQQVPTPARDNTNALHALADDVYATTTAPLRALDVWQRGEDERTARENRRLDAVLGIHSPSPELSLGEEIERMEAQIAADHALAQRLSQDPTYEDNLVALPSPSPSAIASSSRLPALSPSPDFPASILLPPPSLGRANAPAVTEARREPRTRVQAPSVIHRAPKSKPHTITTQLNATWMSMQPRSSPPPVSVPCPSLHVSQGGVRRPFVPLGQTRRFVLLFLTGAAPVILSVDASGLHDWPSYRLSEDEGTLTKLRRRRGLETLGTTMLELETFLQRQRRWMGVDLTHVHTVGTNAVLILRPLGVEGKEDADAIKSFLPEAAPVHLRYNLPAERAAVRRDLKAKGNQGADDSDSDVEVVREIAVGEPSSKAQGKRKAETPSPKRPYQRPHLSITTSFTGGDSADEPVTIDSPPPSALSLLSAAPSSASSAAPSSPRSSPSPPPPPHTQERDRRWPYGMYVVDMADGFKDIDDMRTLRIPRPERFKRAFKAPYVSSTYDNQRQWWEQAGKFSALTTDAIKAGHTPAGLWLLFRQNVAALEKGSSVVE